MNKYELQTNRLKRPLIVRVIDFIINNLLHLSLIVLFIIVFRKILGESKVADIVSFVIGLLLASAIFFLIKRNAKGFLFLLLFTVPAFALALAFLFM